MRQEISESSSSHICSSRFRNSLHPFINNVNTAGFCWRVVRSTHSSWGSPAYLFDGLPLQRQLSLLGNRKETQEQRALVSEMLKLLPPPPQVTGPLRGTGCHAGSHVAAPLPAPQTPAFLGRRADALRAHSPARTPEGTGWRRRLQVAMNRDPAGLGAGRADGGGSGRRRKGLRQRGEPEPFPS